MENVKRNTRIMNEPLIFHTFILKIMSERSGFLSVIMLRNPVTVWPSVWMNTIVRLVLLPQKAFHQWYEFEDSLFYKHSEEILVLRCLTILPSFCALSFLSFFPIFFLTFTLFAATTQCSEDRGSILVKRRTLCVLHPCRPVLRPSQLNIQSITVR
jgi:hypothetical protein